MSTVIEKQTAAVPSILTSSTDSLTADEKARFDKCESALHNHFATFKSAGEALLQIRDQRLYRETMPTFETYCRVKWDMSRQQANRLIAAAKVVSDVARFAPELASATANLTESAVRSLAQLDTKQATKVLRAVSKRAPGLRGVTAKVLTAEAKKVAPAAFAHKPRSDGDGHSDLVRRSEAIEAIKAWQKERGEKLSSLKPAAVVAAIVKLIKEL